MGKAQDHALRIATAIQEARTDGVNVLLDWDEDDEFGVYVKLITYVIKRDENGVMQMIEGPFMVEGH